MLLTSFVWRIKILYKEDINLIKERSLGLVASQFHLVTIKKINSQYLVPQEFPSP